ncbi:Transmembrane protein 97 [Rhizoclosmatium sp. JEL0117]|nr:Transmembrane protein 97 [Rhizoclosmatium sp. JEL0117]
MSPPTKNFRRPLLSRPGDIAIIVFFALHIPITLISGTQLILPKWTKENFPDFALNAVSDYIRDTNDVLVIKRPLWFISTCWAEFFVQLPFYIYLIYALIADSKHVRTAGIIYATHTCTCLVPILYEMVLDDSGMQTPEQKWNTIGIYSVWFLMPLFILVSMIWRKEAGVKGKSKEE